ncbi:MAG: ABC transporter ATP-binding protein [Aquisalimonadaceae bacterium]
MKYPALKLENLSKAFGADYAVQGINLDVEHGETVALLGPSGCGKSTTLRMVAGLEQPTDGAIYCEGKVIASVADNLFCPPEKRNIGMVFQAYALWPHKTAYENVAYPLELRRIKASVVRRKVYESLELVGLAGLEDRPVPRLSGGQQQRVALARALVYEPSILLLDEPFSNLDTKLRTQLRLELKELQKKIKLTTLFVTHDQVEALSVADRVVIMNSGRVEQIDAPGNVYEKSRTRFVRDFLGKVITLEATVKELPGPGKLRLAVDDCAGTQMISASCRSGSCGVGDRMEIAIRPEEVRVGGVDQDLRGGNVVEGRIEALLYVGSCFESKIRIGKESVFLDIPRSINWKEQQPIFIQLPESSITLWPLEKSGPPSAPDGCRQSSEMVG